MAKLKENSTILKYTGEEIIATEESVDRKLLLKADKDDLDAHKAETEQQKADLSVLTYINVQSPPPPFIGAVGDGVTDDTVAIQTLLDNFNNIYFPCAEYLISNTLIITNNKKLLGHFATLKANTMNLRLLSATGELKNINPVPTKNISIYDNLIELDSADGIEVGDIIHLKSDMLWYYDNRDSLYKGEIFEVIDIDNNKIILDHDSSDGYILQNETVDINVYKPITVNIKGIKFLHGSVGIGLNKDSIIENIEIDNKNGATGMSINNSIRTKVIKVIVKNCYLEGTGYGIQDNGSTSTEVIDSYFNNNKRGVDFSGGTPSRFGVVRGCTVRANGYDDNGTRIFNYTSGFGTHGTAEAIVFENNRIQDVREGIIIRGKSCVVRSNDYRGRVVYGVVFSAGEDLTVDNNTYESLRYFKTITDEDVSKHSSMGLFVTCTIENAINNLTITNNKADILSWGLLNIHADIQNLNLFGNQLFLNSNSSNNNIFIINGLDGRTITVSRLFYKNNNIRIGTGTYTEIKNVTVTNVV